MSIPPKSVSINAAAKAVMKDGHLLDRAAVLSQLGLNPTTPPDAWLAIVACGSNASGLHPGDLNSLVSSGKVNKAALDAHALGMLRGQGG